jgi:hypothetical protein
VAYRTSRQQHPYKSARRRCCDGWPKLQVGRSLNSAALRSLSRSARRCPSLLAHAILFLDLHDGLQTATGPRNQDENLSARQFAKLTADARSRIRIPVCRPRLCPFNRFLLSGVIWTRHPINSGIGGLNAKNLSHLIILYVEINGSKPFEMKRRDRRQWVAPATAPCIHSGLLWVR